MKHTTLKIKNRRLIKQVFSKCAYGLVIIPLDLIPSGMSAQDLIDEVSR